MTAQRKSLDEVYGTVDTTKHKSAWRRLLAFWVLPTSSALATWIQEIGLLTLQEEANLATH